MKKACVLFFWVWFLVSFAQNVSLTITVKNSKNNKGKIYVAIYNKEEDFLKKHYVGKGQIISLNSSIFVFSLPKGTYAVSTFHDENNNEKLDTNLLGIPKERYGFSNNARSLMSAPSFTDAKFQLSADKSIEITVK